eukprot:COSAG02_NODE_34614_length_481_cov_0.892670_1_plen_78_part_10
MHTADDTHATHMRRIIWGQQREFAEAEYVINSMILHWRQVKELAADRDSLRVIPPNPESEYRDWLIRHDAAAWLKEAG